MAHRIPLTEKNVFPGSQKEDALKPAKKQRSKKAKLSQTQEQGLPLTLGHIMLMPVDIFAEIASNLTPFCLLTLSRSTKRNFFCEKQFNKFFHDLPSTILQAVPSTVGPKLPTPYYFLPMVQQVALKYKRLRGQSDVRLCWIQERWKMNRDIYSTVTDLNDWVEREAVEKRHKTQDTMLSRKAEIIANLQDLGWQPSDYPPDQSHFWNLLEQPRGLTPRIWTSIRPKLLQYLEDEKDVRAQLSRRERNDNVIHLFLKDERIQRSCAEVHLNAKDIEILPSIADIINDSNLVTPDAIVARWDAIRDQCQKEALGHVKRVRRELAGLFMDATRIGRDTYQKIKDDVAKGDLPPCAEVAYELNLLSSPYAIFSCTLPECLGLHKFQYPSLLSDPHLAHKEWTLDSVCLEPMDFERCRNLMEKLKLPVMDVESEGWLTCRDCIDEESTAGPDHQTLCRP
ncbi:hypothetical protein FRB96_002796 [Tulasnella sp. 330]|nr:hypothetical protein FRB96_002796 [Tulasnella sp. 330]